MRQVLLRSERNLSNTNMQTDASTMATGGQTAGTDKARSSGRVALHIQVNSETIVDMGRERSYTQTGPNMTENGATTSETAEENFLGWMGPPIAAISETIKCTERGPSSGRASRATKGSGDTTRKTGKAQ